MNDDAAEYLSRWKIKALNDFSAAEILLNAENCPCDTVVYHCQQAVEKYLKMILSMNGIAFRKTHDLEVLFGLLPDVSPELATIRDGILTLNSYGTGIRYPDDFYMPSKDEALSVFAVAKEIVKVLHNLYGVQ